MKPTVEQINACLNLSRFKGLARRIVGETAWDDCIQESKIKAWKNLGTFREDCPLERWLHRIVYNAAINIVRARRTNVVELDDFEGGEDCNRDLVDRSASKRMGQSLMVARYQETITAAIRQACRAMDESDRKMLLSRFRDGRKLCAMATERGVHQTNIMRKLERICAKLKTEIHLALVFSGQLSNEAAQECMDDMAENPHYFISILDEIGSVN